MQQSTRLWVLKNPTEETITDYWDGKPYSFPPGELVTLVFGVGVHFRTHHPELELVEDKEGMAPDIIVHETTLVNRAPKALDLMWDGHPYHLEPGATMRIEASIAEALILQARKNGGDPLVVEGSSKPEKAATTTEPVEPETPPAAEAEAETVESPTPKKTARSKKAGKATDA
jgi:hypothetical protein